MSSGDRRHYDTERRFSVTFDGTQHTYQHRSSETGTMMRFAAFVPPQARQSPVPVVWYLSGLTCTEENFTTKAGAQRIAAELGLLLIAPDTSPRGDGVHKPR
jgi:S-formylglutathione hydrolase